LETLRFAVFQAKPKLTFLPHDFLTLDLIFFYSFIFFAQKTG
jgi:hypothetical protein